jgi:hypothetical protein
VTAWLSLLYEAGRHVRNAAHVDASRRQDPARAMPCTLLNVTLVTAASPRQPCRTGESFQID